MTPAEVRKVLLSKVNQSLTGSGALTSDDPPFEGRIVTRGPGPILDGRLKACEIKETLDESVTLVCCWRRIEAEKPAFGWTMAMAMLIQTTSKTKTATTTVKTTVE